MASDNGNWQPVALPKGLQQGGSRAVLKLDGRQLAVFRHGDELLACDNRCPHEGYPLSEGTLAGDGVLTCQWHNWKFDLRSGRNLHGGDALRCVPVRQDGEQLWLDLSEPPPAERQRQALRQLEDAAADHDMPRIARELARLLACGGSVEHALAAAVQRSHERLRYGMTHAWAAAEAWLRLADQRSDDAQRLCCATEALGYVALDTLREPPYPFDPQVAARWDEAAFLAAAEAQDEAAAAGLLRAALAAGVNVEAVCSQAALAHYSDFGHTLIYLTHVRRLLSRLGPESAAPLWLGWLRSLCFATREDLLPDFKACAPTLAQWPQATPMRAAAPPDPRAWVGLPVGRALALTLAEAARCAPLAVWEALAAAGAWQLLRFDTAHEARTEGPVSANVGWLDFSHALTFAQAVREQCLRQPSLWPQGLLQMSLFVGRNAPWLREDDELQRWQVSDGADAAAFDERCVAQLLDHGLQPPIYPAHLLKTWMAVQQMLHGGVAPQTAVLLRAALNRLFNSPLKQRHALRNARQALDFVRRSA